MYVIISIISLIVGVFIYYGTVLFADIQYLTGTVIGVIYSLRRCQPGQPFLKYGAIVGVLGGIFSSIFISGYQTILLSLTGKGNIYIFFLYLGFTLLSGVVIGLLAGALLGTFYAYKETKTESKVETEDKVDDDFYEDLIDK